MTGAGSTPEHAVGGVSRRGDMAPPAPRGAPIEQAGEIRSARVESLRGVAALAVLVGHVFGTAHHYNPATTFDTLFHRTMFGGGFAVFLFFALSGYLLYWPFARRDFGGGGRVDLGRYARNRALRILPLYFAVVIVVLLAQEHGGSAGQWWRFLTFSESYSRETVAQVDGPIWSLVVELHFYVLLPLIAMLVARLSGGSRARAAAALGVLAAVFLLVRYQTVTVHHGAASPLWRYSTPSNFYFFFAGMLLALLRLSWEERRPGWVRGPLAHSNTWMAAAMPLWLIVFDHYDRDALSAAAAFLMVGACVLPLTPGALVSALEWRPLAAVGLASYSLYLWHVPIVDYLGRHVATASFPKLLALAAPVCVVVALASYAVIEAPFLRLRRRWAPASAPQSAAAQAPSPAR